MAGVNMFHVPNEDRIKTHPIGEPEKRKLCDPMGSHPYLSQEIYLQICEQRILAFDELIDERPKETEKSDK